MRSPENLSEKQLLERADMINALGECNGVITAAAEKFGVARQTFVNKMDEYEIPRIARQEPRKL